MSTETPSKRPSHITILVVGLLLFVVGGTPTAGCTR